jgi:cold shock CspA family protein
MQATVRTFSPSTRSGTVLLDNGTDVPFDAAAFAAGGYRLLRFGQRVAISIEGSRVTWVGLPTSGVRAGTGVAVGDADGEPGKSEHGTPAEVGGQHGQASLARTTRTSRNSVPQGPGGRPP